MIPSSILLVRRSALPCLFRALVKRREEKKKKTRVLRMTSAKTKFPDGRGRDQYLTVSQLGLIMMMMNVM